jgi:4-hydroxy-3-polyprenylbenzoate decarboxylase
VFPTLRSFTAALERCGELRRITCEVSPLLEISAIADAISKSPCVRRSRWAAAFDRDHAGFGGSALLFERVAGCDFPLLINAFGSHRRMEMALGVEERGGLESIAARIASLAKPQPPRSLRETLAKAREFLPLLRIAPRLVRRGRCQEVVRLASRGEVDLTRLPIIKCWPLDGDPSAVGYPITPEQAGTAAGQGRYITFAGMHTIHSSDRQHSKPASHNIGMYRAQLIDRTRLAMHWHMHHDGAAHWRSWKALGQRMPIAICLGGESVMAYGATAPLPPGISELLMCGFLNGRGIPMVRAKTVPLRVPANSEIVIEGWVSTECGPVGWDPRPQRGDGSPLGPGAVFEGPFGDHTGFYSLPDRYPIVEVTAITHARDALYPTTVVGPPPQEDYALGKATERIFLPLLRTLIHDVDEYHLPQYGCFHNAAFIRIRKAYPLQARRVMHSIWGAGQMAWTKTLAVVDDSIDVHDDRAVWRAILERCDFRRDVEIVHGPLDILDHAAPFLGAGGKIGFDATRRLEGEALGGIPIDRSPLGTTTEPIDAWLRNAGLRNAGLQDAGLQDAGLHDAGLHDLGLSRCGVRRMAMPFARREDDEPWTRRMVAISLDSHAATTEGPDVAAMVMDRFWLLAPAGIGDLLMIVDGSVDPTDCWSVLFHWVSNADPARDRITRGDANASCGRLGFDATCKRPGFARHQLPAREYPPPLSMDEATTALLRRRWLEYGLPGSGPPAPGSPRNA